MELKENSEKAGIRTQTLQLRPEFSCGLAFSNVFVWWPLDQIVLIFSSSEIRHSENRETETREAEVGGRTHSPRIHFFV